MKQSHGLAIEFLSSYKLHISFIWKTKIRCYFLICIKRLGGGFPAPELLPKPPAIHQFKCQNHFVQTIQLEMQQLNYLQSMVLNTDTLCTPTLSWD